MTGSDLLSKLVLSLNSYLYINNDSVIDAIDPDDDLEEALYLLINLVTDEPFKRFINCLDEIRRNNNNDFLTTPYTNLGTTHIIDFNDPILEKKDRTFAHNDLEFGFLSSRILFDNNDNLIEFSKEEHFITWKVLETYFERCYSILAEDSVCEVFDMIKNQDKNKGIIIKKTTGTFEKNRCFSYIYLSYLNNSNSVQLPQELTYSRNIIDGSLQIDLSKNYEQFFDIYDVINELNQAPDILSRFLKMYHILEYLVYRVYLVDLVTRVGNNKFFVREFIGSAESMKKQERDSFIKNFDSIFSSDLAIIDTTLTPNINSNVTDFLRDKNIVRGFSSNNTKKVAELIYGLRCCIVHNKESEYHMTLTNYEEYNDILPLIKETINIFEILIINKIKNNDPNIKYPSNTVKLY